MDHGRGPAIILARDAVVSIGYLSEYQIYFVLVLETVR